MRIVIITCLSSVLVFAGSARGSVPRKVELEKYSALYHAVRQDDARAAGRNLRSRGVRFKWVARNGARDHWATRPATAHEVALGIRRLRSMRVQQVATAVPRAVLGGGDGYTIPTAIVMCESGGNPRAVNTGNPDRPAGTYQIITSTWLANGGGQFAPTADAATPAEQGVVAARIWDGGRGRGQWAC